MKNVFILFGLSAILGLALQPTGGQALEYPNRPIQFVVGTAAGGPADSAARIIADESSKILKNPVVVLNKPGASGTISAATVAGSKPDGYTILVGMTMSLSAGFALLSDVRYKLSDFEPVARHIIFPFVIAAKSEAPWKSLKEFLEDARRNPDKFKSGSDGGGTSLGWEAVISPSNVKVAHVIFKGAAPNFTALLGGHVDICATTLTPLVPQLEAKQIRLLATSSKMKEYPDVPTFTELGFPDAARDFWNGFLAPAKTPQPIVGSLSETIKKSLDNPTISERLLKIGVLPSYQGPKEFGEFLQKEYDVFMSLGKKYKIEE